MAPKKAASRISKRFTNEPSGITHRVDGEGYAARTVAASADSSGRCESVYTQHWMPSARTKDYVNLLPLSDGGMGTVTLAMRKDGAFQRLYAIKRIHTQFVDDEQFLRMFIDEGRIAGLIRHPNVVSVIDVGTDASGPFMVMDYIEGVSLTKLICQPEELDLRVGLRIMRDVARGLHEAHELVDHQGTALRVIHRDISPQNILVSYEGAVKVIDFGLAKATGRLVTTQVGIVKGKLAYLSAEQARGESIDYRSDIFSLGTCFYEWLTGQRLFLRQSDPDTVIAVQQAMVPPLRAVRPELPSELQEIVGRALQPDPAHRFQTAAEMQEALLAFAVDAGIPLRRRNISDFMVGLFPEDHQPPPRERRETMPADSRHQPMGHFQGATSTGRGIPSVEEELSLVDIIAPEADPFDGSHDRISDDDVQAVRIVEHDSSASPSGMSGVGYGSAYPGASSSVPAAAPSVPEDSPFVDPWSDEQTFAISRDEFLADGDVVTPDSVAAADASPTGIERPLARERATVDMNTPAQLEPPPESSQSVQGAESLPEPTSPFDMQDEHTVQYSAGMVQKYLAQAEASRAFDDETRVVGEGSSSVVASFAASSSNPPAPAHIAGASSEESFDDQTQDTSAVFEDETADRHGAFIDALVAEIGEFDDMTHVEPIQGDETQPSVQAPAFGASEAGDDA